MLRDRLLMGAILIALVTGVLALDQSLAPWYPFLLLLAVLLALVAAWELRTLLARNLQMPAWLTLFCTLAVILSNWPSHLGRWRVDPWYVVCSTYAGVVLLVFLVEMARFNGTTASTAPGEAVTRIAVTLWQVAYLGLLASFLVQLRWLPGENAQPGGRGVGALSLAIFVPKFCDIGAYFTGRLIGRHPMSPHLSPKKTWEGLAGGLALSAGTAVGINRLLPVLGSAAAAAGFGILLGLAGVLGDLAESLIKRDCHTKDASHVMPGFGGVLDVIDSILFAAPVAYWWLHAG
jgi:phosphatidate cytidylyltransferase